MDTLTDEQRQSLEDQLSRITTDPEGEGIPGEHLNLIGLLNRFGYNPMSKQEAVSLAIALLQGDDEENIE